MSLDVQPRSLFANRRLYIYAEIISASHLTTSLSFNRDRILLRHLAYPFSGPPSCFLHSYYYHKRVCLTCKLQSEQNAARHCRSSQYAAMTDCRLPAYESMHGDKRESCMYIHIPVCVLVCNNTSCRDMQQALPEYSLCRCLLSWRRGDDGRNCGYIVDVYPALALRDNAVVLSAWRCLPSFPYFSFLHMAGRWQPYALFPALSFPLCSSFALNDSPGNLNQI